MAKQYVIRTPHGYVKESEISVITEQFEVVKAVFTQDLQEAKMFNQENYKHDLDSWERYLGIKEHCGLLFREVEKKIVLK